MRTVADRLSPGRSCRVSSCASLGGIVQVVMNHPRRRVTYPKLMPQRQGREPCLRLADHVNRLQPDGERQLGGFKNWFLPLASSDGGSSCIDIAFDAGHESHRSVPSTTRTAKPLPAIEPFQARLRTCDSVPNCSVNWVRERPAWYWILFWGIAPPLWVVLLYHSSVERGAFQGLRSFLADQVILF